MGAGHLGVGGGVVCEETGLQTVVVGEGNGEHS